MMEQLILDHLYLVKQEMRKLEIQPDWLDDYYQEGAIGLIKAARKADPERLELFSAYARKHIRGQMLAINFSLVKIPRNVRAAARETNEQSIESVAADKRNSHTVKSLAAAKAAMASTVVEYDPRRDGKSSDELERLELGDQLESILDDLTELQLRALEAWVMGTGALAELDRIHNTSRNAHSHALCCLKKRLGEENVRQD